MGFTPGASPGDDGGVGFTQSSAKSGLFGRNDATNPPPPGTPGGAGVFGLTVSSGAAGVFGANNHATAGVGVQGNGPEAGLSGFSEAGVGVRAHSNHGDSIQGFAHSNNHNGILGHNNNAQTSGQAAPSSGAPAGNGVFGFTQVPNGSGVVGAVEASNTGGSGITGIGPTAGRFFGDMLVTGNITTNADLILTNGADCAEEFDVSTAGYGPVDPGTVVVLDDQGSLRQSEKPYDTRVAGIVSGAGGYRPGVILDRRGDGNRAPIALVGKAYCKVDADYGQIGVGDLLTTSATPGHAMKAGDPVAAFGAVIGKALRPCTEGRGMIPVLIALQ